MNWRLFLSFILTVAPVWLASAAVPVSKDDIVTTAPGVAVTIQPLQNDSDPDGDALTVSGFDQPRRGTVERIDASTLRYTPAEGFVGYDEFTYRVLEGYVSEDGAYYRPAKVHIFVSPNGKTWLVARDDSSIHYMSWGRISVLANDFDPDGKPLVVESFTQPSNGRVALIGRGVFALEAMSGSSGSFTYRISNGEKVSNTATVNFNLKYGTAHITAVRDDSAVTGPGQAVNVYVRANDEEVYTIAGFTSPAHGSVVQSGTEVVRYTPEPGFEGVDQFTYSVTGISNGQAPIGQGTVRITVTSQSGPQVQPDSAVTGRGEAVDVAVLSNDFELRGVALALVDFTPGAHGTVTRVGAGTLRYTPEVGFLGEDSFTYRATNGNESSQSTVQIRVVDRKKPVANADVASTGHNAWVAIPVLLNDVSRSGGSLTVAEVFPPANGVAYRSNGAVIYVPGNNFVGEDSFDYLVTDGVLSARGTVRVSVTNSAPVVQADSVSTLAGIAVTAKVLENDSDADKDPLKIDTVSTPANGSVSLDYDNKTVTYRPAAGFAGIDTFTYTVTDGWATVQGTVQVNVGANQPPVARDDQEFGLPGVARDIYVRDNDTDLENIAPLNAVVVDPPKHGTVSNAIWNDPYGYVEARYRFIGAFSYKADDDYIGEDEFTYKVFDGNSYSAPATVRITVRSNTPPTAVDDYAVIPVGETKRRYVTVLGNDFDADGNAFSVVSATEAAHGSVEVASGILYYTPGSSYNGVDQFTYTIADSQGLTASATVTISSNPNAAPIANQDSARLARNATFVSIPVLSNDSDPDGDSLTIEAGSGSNAKYGTVSRVGDVLIYRPKADYLSNSEEKRDSFSYGVIDAYGNSASAWVSVTFSDQNHWPSVQDDDVRLMDRSPLRINVLANDWDADGDVLTISNVSTPSKGSAVVDGNSIVYTPTPGSEIYSTSFTYTVSDGRGGSATATVSVSFSISNSLDEVFTATGRPVPGAGDPESGIPAGAVFQSFGVPSINDAGALAFLATYRSGDITARGIFAGKPLAPIVQTGTVAPGVDGVVQGTDRFQLMKDPLLNASGDVAFTASVKGASGGKRIGIWSKPHNGLLRQVVSAGQNAIGVPGAAWKSITSVALTDSGTIFFVAKAENRRTAVKTTGLWASDPSATTGMQLLLKQGDLLDLGGVEKKVKDFVALAPAPNSAGQGRLSVSAIPVRVRWTDGSEAILVCAPDESPVALASSGHAAFEGSRFESFGLPALNRFGQVAVVAKVRAAGERSSGTSRSGIFASSPEGGLSLVARQGDLATDLQGEADSSLGRFLSFSAPVYNAQQRTAFIARIIGPARYATPHPGLWWTAPNGRLTFLSQTFQGAEFISLALPDGPNAGPIWTIRVKRKGAPIENRLCAVNASGGVDYVVRTQQRVYVAGQEKIVRYFDLLGMIPGSPAQVRSYNGQKQVVYRAMFTDGTEAIVQAQLY